MLILYYIFVRCISIFFELEEFLDCVIFSKMNNSV